MATNLYTTKTAALKATKADIRNLNVQKMTLGGKTIIDIIKQNMLKVKVADTNLTGLKAVTENGIVTLSDGKFEIVNQWFEDVHIVKDNEGFNRSGVKVLSIDTKNITAIHTMSIGAFSNNVYEWYGDLSSLKSINVEDSEIPCVGPFRQNGYLKTFIGDLSSLEDGNDMFYECQELTTFIGDLSSLENGIDMFKFTALSKDSLECIEDTIQDLTKINKTGEIGISWWPITSDFTCREGFESNDEQVSLKMAFDIMTRITKKGWIVWTNSNFAQFNTDNNPNFKFLSSPTTIPMGDF